MIFASEGLVKFSFYWLADCSNFENADTMRTRKTKNRVGLSSDAVSGAQDKFENCNFMPFVNTLIFSCLLVYCKDNQYIVIVDKIV